MQLLFGFINAPLFATFLLGMFWKRATGHGAFWGLVAGTLGAATTYGLTLAEGKGGWILNTPVYEFHSAMGQAFGVAIVSWTTCFIVTIAISLVTKPKPDAEMVGLVHSLTVKPKETVRHWYLRPLTLACVVLGVSAVLNYMLR